VTALALGLAVAGVAWGLLSDRIAARWPAHDHGRVRPVDWRTLAVALVGGGAMGAVGQRFPDLPELLLFGGYVLALILLLATDLDQRLLPDVITLPLIPIAAIAAVSGLNPLVEGELLGAVVAALIFPIGLFLLSVPFGAGAIGMGDLKMMISVGLVAGLYRTLLGLMAGALLSGVVVLLLLVTRRVTLRTYIPFGPFLILGAIWAILLQT
jgi:leader peptidase (prepilin peptidase) / N-methyltransferase